MKINLYSFLNKKILSSALLVAASINTQAQLPSWLDCFAPASGGCMNDKMNAYMTRIVTSGGIVNLDNTSTCSETAPNYADFTANGKMVQQVAGKSFDVRITYKGGSEGPKTLVKIFVDWNRNGKFDLPQEYVSAPGWMGGQHPHEIGALNGSVTIKVPVPGWAKEGQTRMRIVNSSLFLSVPQLSSITPCSLGGDGEAEDHMVDVINPCLPPPVTSVAKLGNFKAELSWSKRENAEFYEYLVTTNPTPPTSIGYSFTKDTKIDIDTFQCDVTYYLFVRSICDTAGRTDVQWKKSDWKIDSFKTHPCCNIPDVKIDQVSSTTARFSWDPVYTAKGYEYGVSTTNVPPVRFNYTVNNIVVQQGLTPSKRYYVFVRARCSPTPLSDWHIQNFKTGQYTSVETVGNNDFSMNAYPNPMADNVIVKLDGQRTANARLTVIDLTGKVVYNAPVTTQEVKINTGGFAPGLYVIKYADDLHNEIMRVTKK